MRVEPTAFGGAHAGIRWADWWIAVGRESAPGFEGDSKRVVGCDGDVVRRRAGSWTPAVHGLLAHLEAVAFPYSPRVLGFDEDGCELLTYIPGVSGRDSWAKVVPEDGMAAFARLLRLYHDAVAGYRPTTAEWATVEESLEDGEVICHGDFGPWNVVWQGSDPVGIIDWDLAGPRPPLHDVAYALEYGVPFRDDEECMKCWRTQSHQIAHVA
jgi:hypothetical protein